MRTSCKQSGDSKRHGRRGARGAQAGAAVSRCWVGSWPSAAHTAQQRRKALGDGLDPQARRQEQYKGVKGTKGAGRLKSWNSFLLRTAHAAPAALSSATRHCHTQIQLQPPPCWHSCRQLSGMGPRQRSRAKGLKAGSAATCIPPYTAGPCRQSLLPRDPFHPQATTVASDPSANPGAPL